MPIYAYRCEACGHQQDALQKISAAPLTLCAACGAETLKKQVTAAGFQLKGSGWYVTDFRNNGAAPAAAKKAEGEADKAAVPATAEGGAAAATPATAVAAPAAAPSAATPAPASGGTAS